MRSAGRFGKIVAGLIAEGQSEPAIRQAFFDRWVSPRRAATIADLPHGKNTGELQSDTEMLRYWSRYLSEKCGAIDLGI